MNLYNLLRKVILPLEQIDYYIPKRGQIIDLGCGQGVISVYLARIPTRRVIGVDTNAKKLPNSSTKNLSFIKADINLYSTKGAKGIILSDVLHHMDINNQKKLLTKVKKLLSPKGVLVIKEIDTKEFIRSRLSRIWDYVLYPNDAIYYWSSSDLGLYLDNLGFKVKVQRTARFFPGSTTLFICKK